jgi:hypothetical protein
MVRMQRSLLTAAFAAWLCLEPSLASARDPTEWLEAKRVMKDEEEEEDFISFLHKTIVATVDATREIGLKGTQ